MPTRPTPLEARAIVGAIEPQFADFVMSYDTKKYPSDVYQDALAKFRHPANVSPDTLRNALLWKYGHLGKSAIPQHHERLIAEIQSGWSKFVAVLPETPEETFAVLDRDFGGKSRFITVAFLLHLLHHDEVPIIDQHNFRAVNALMTDARPGWPSKKKPSRYADIVVITEFMEGVLAAWGQIALDSLPNDREFDKFLMMYGKAIKRTKNRSIPNRLSGWDRASDAEWGSSDSELLKNFVRVNRTKQEIHILVCVIRWTGPHTSTKTWLGVGTLPSGAPETDVQSAMASMLHNPRFFRVCEECRQRKPAGRMHSTSICHGCAEANHGVIH